MEKQRLSMKKNGKNICKELKTVRRRIAEENHIPLEIKECNYEGPCRGTCPRCESEVRYLENALADRLRRGKVATVAGLALGLAVSSGVKAQSTEPPAAPTTSDLGEERNGMCEVTGVVVDGRTREAVPVASVMLYKDSAKALVASTDFDGRYRFSVPAGHYTLVAKSVGYAEYRREVDVKGFTSGQPDAALEATAVVLDTARLETSMTGLVEVVVITEGTVIDEKTQEPLPFVAVLVKQNGKQVVGTVTDFDGNFSLELPEGEYVFEISTIGYQKKTFTVKLPSDKPLTPIKLESTGVPLIDTGIIINKDAVPLINLEAPGAVEGMEVEGVQVRIQY